MKALPAAALALLNASFSGLVLWALLESSRLGLAPVDARGIGIFWISGLGVGIALRAWSEGPWPQAKRLLNLVVFSLAAFVLLPGLPFLLERFPALPTESLEPALAWFWDSAASQARPIFWQAVLAAAGCLGGLLFSGYLSFWALGLGLALAGSSVWARDPLELLNLATVALVLLRLACLLLGLFWGRSKARSLDAIDLESHDFGWASEEPPVLRPRLAGVMLLAVFLIAAVFGLIQRDINQLSGGTTQIGSLCALAFLFGIGCLVGKGLVSFAPRLARAELVPMYLLLGATTWFGVSGASGARWFELGELLRSSLPATWAWPQAQIGRYWMDLMLVGPAALSAGTAAIVLPSLAFARSPKGRQRSRLLLGASVFLVGCLAWQPMESLLFVNPGPGFFIAGLIGLAGICFFLIVDSRGQSVAPVKGRPSALFCTAGRCTVGLLFTWLGFSVATPRLEQLDFSGLELRAELQRIQGYRGNFRFGFGDPITGQHMPWIESTDWVHAVQKRREGQALLLDLKSHGRLLASASRLAGLLGAPRAPLVVEARQQVGLERQADQVGTKAPAWVLDLSAHGPDPVRAVSSSSYQALARLAGDGRLVCSWLPLDLPEQRFQRGLEDFASSFAFSTAWLVDGFAFLVGGQAGLQLDLSSGASARRRAASFVGVLTPDPDQENTGGWVLARRRTDRIGGVVSQLLQLRRKARNLQALIAGRTAFPPAWDGLLGQFPEVLVGRALSEMHLAAAWVAYDRLAAPDSLALETWQRRLDSARLDAGLQAPNDPELISFDSSLRAENDLAAARGFLLESNPRAAVGLLLSAREVLSERRDLELLLAAAFDLAGNQNAADLTYKALGPSGPALLQSSGSWLKGLGFEPSKATRQDEQR